MNHKNIGRKNLYYAFTLIELIVVIAIICILTSLLLPSMSKVRALGRSVKCLSNVRQLGSAFQMYCDDNNDMMPANGPSPYWFNALNFYIRNWQIFQCPEDKSFRGMTVDPFNASYGYNYTGLGWDNTVTTHLWRRTEVARPTETVIVLDCQFYNASWLYMDVFVNRHGSNVNVSWVDGHASSAPVSTLSSASAINYWDKN